jgi:glycosyltransferase involved in cell wall biosynthesis
MAHNGKIRVLQFLNESVRAGAEEVAFEIFRRLDPRRYQSYLVCPPALVKAFSGDWQGENSVMHELKLDDPWQIPQANRFVSFLREEKIDVVHAHMIRGALAAVPLARLAGVPVVVHTCHGREVWRKSWLKRQFWIDRRITDWSDATIAVSEATAAHLLHDKKLDPKKVKVIRNGRTVNGFKAEPGMLDELRACLGIEPGTSVVGVFARLEPQKAHKYLIEALPAILRKVPQLKVIFAGDGSLRRELEGHVGRLGLTGVVIFTGYRRDSMELMSLCNLVALPSIHEGMPLVPIEAAALGKAVVATAVDGTKEVVADGETGILVPPEQPQRLADAITRLLLDANERARMGERGRALANEEFTLERQIQVTADFYEELLSSHNGHSR